MKEATLHNFEDEILSSNLPCIVKFTSEHCHLCVVLAPIFERLEAKYAGKLNFFNVNTFAEEKLTEIFSGDGVPTVYIFADGGASEIPYPEVPDEDSGYSEKYLKTYLDNFLN